MSHAEALLPKYSVMVYGTSLSHVTASNSRHNPVERIAILIFGSDLGARLDSKLEHGAVLGPNTALLSANSRPEISEEGTRTECSLVEMQSGA